MAVHPRIRMRMSVEEKAEADAAVTPAEEFFDSAALIAAGAGLGSVAGPVGAVVGGAIAAIVNSRLKPKKD